MPPGRLDVTAVSAQGLKETEVLGKQDPYAVITAGNTKQKTSVHKDGGKTATWNQHFVYQLAGNENEVLVEVFNKNSMGKDDLIGKGRHPLHTVFAALHENCWVPIERGNNKSSGMVNLALAFHPMQHGNPAQPGGYPPQAGYPPQQPGGYPPQAGYPPPQPGGYPPQGSYPPQQPGAYPPQPGYPPAHSAPPYGAAAAGAAVGAAAVGAAAAGQPNVPVNYYPPPPSGYPTPGGAAYPAGASQAKPPGSGSSAMMYGLGGAAAGAAMGAGAMYVMQSHGKHKDKYKPSGYKHKGYKHKGYKHKGFKHKGFKHKGFKHKGFKHKGYKWKKK